VLDHSCQRSDDDEAVIANLLIFGRFAIPEHQPPFPPRRAAVLAKLQRRWAWRTAALEQKAGVAPVDREPRHEVDLWPREQIRDRIPAPRKPMTGEVARRVR
jgi:hypothetical protein